ncbi:hypothetical protein AMJ71_02010 [candidate division TA06 bacterium SM1_40]|uniref:Trimethylamine methyltransferase n=2 Tax=Bacteria division TA06 TaxID=1156500 RepID=A0A0S8JM58_UNCT6|nr:MAG: hypothetical protein AMJ82_03455 [candidate division TA06 bacterium SM23_40]KPL10744.1 MAG: hypothetical protein AMJ71_02010 [candidate division TA06 bacterium SM1_40]
MARETTQGDEVRTEGRSVPRRPRLSLLERSTIERIVDEARELLQSVGVIVEEPEALDLLADGGAEVDLEQKRARLTAPMVEKALATVPRRVELFDRAGTAAVIYAGDRVQFDPGSAALHVLDADTRRIRKATTEDIISFAKLAEGLDELDAQSTAIIAADVPEAIADSYRLYLLLQLTEKPIVTGAFSGEGLLVMHRLLAASSGGEGGLKARPRAVFDVCPSPPLLWSQATCRNLVDCARFGLPAQLVSMPLAGATGPVTLIGAVTQHAAENLSGIVIHQLACPGAPIIWGGSPAIFDMREGTTPMGAVETMMIDCAYAEVGKHFGLPTHTYMGLSDTKVLDMQTGLESGMGTVLAILAGINLVSGAGMLDFESCQSPEKLVVDCEIIGMARRLSAGLAMRDEERVRSLYTEDHNTTFLTLEHTLRWLKDEQRIPSFIIDRAGRRRWEERGGTDVVARARKRVQELVDTYEPRPLSGEVMSEIENIVRSAAAAAGAERLPGSTIE